MTRTNDTEPVDRYTPPQPAGSQVNVNQGPGTGRPVGESSLTTVRRIVGLLFGVLIALIGIRILFLALGANEGNGIVDGIYAITEPFVAPFRGIFSIDQVRPTGTSGFDVAALVAIVGWSLIAMLITAILRISERSASY